MGSLFLVPSLDSVAGLRRPLVQMLQLHSLGTGSFFLDFTQLPNQISHYYLSYHFHSIPLKSTIRMLKSISPDLIGSSSRLRAFVTFLIRRQKLHQPTAVQESPYHSYLQKPREGLIPI